MSDNTFAAERVRDKVSEKSHVSESTEVVVDKVVIYSVAAFAGLVGLWSLACLTSAMYHAGGPIQLVGGWFKAVSGM